MYHPKYNNYYNPSYYTWQDDTIQPEDFTNNLQKELNSSPQPCLVPFLKVSFSGYVLSQFTQLRVFEVGFGVWTAVL